jgi:hypothetical protein
LCRYLFFGVVFGILRFEALCAVSKFVSGTGVASSRRRATQAGRRASNKFWNRRLKEPLSRPPDMAEELRTRTNLAWVRKWAILKERLVEIAKVLRRFPWMVDVVRQRPMNILHPYMAEVYVARDGSEACLSLNPPNAYCAAPCP